jgi:inorganic pyrophosphatase
MVCFGCIVGNTLNEDGDDHDVMVMMMMMIIIIIIIIWSPVNISCLQTLGVPQYPFHM